MTATAVALVVTGSEAAAACGVDPFKSPVALWAEKLDLAPKREAGEAAYWGGLLEPVVLSELNRRDYITLASPGTLTNPLFPWLSGTPDGTTARADDYPSGSEGILEIKTTSPYRRGEWDDDQAPPHVVVQAHVYMILTGLRWTLAACLVGGQKLELREFDYDDDIAAIVLDKTQEFLGYVERQEPPPPDGAQATNDVLARMYPRSTGEVIELTPELYALAREREALREQAKVIEAQQTEKEQALKIALGDASVGMYEGCKVVTWTDVDRAAYSVEAKSYRTFRVKL